MIVAENADQRSKIAVVPLLIGVEEERWLEHYLGLWSGWMRSKDDLPEGCPTEASGGATGYNSFDFDEMLDSMDIQHAQQTQYVIATALTETERNCVLHAYGFIRELAVVRYEVVLVTAREKVKRGLMRAGLWFGG